MSAIVMSVYDFQRLSLLLRKHAHAPLEERKVLAALERKLEQAVLLPPEQIPPNVVTLRSTVRVTNLTSGKRERFTLSFPGETAQGDDRVSILAPLGVALVGERAGSTIVYSAPQRTCRLRIEKIEYQPEAVGELYA